MAYGPKPKPAHERVLARIRVQGDCWIFQGHLHLETGYGYVQTGSMADGSRRPQAVHRVVYEALVGKIPSRAELHHTCKVRACVNPIHLKPISKEDHARLHHAAPKHCKRGHSEWKVIASTGALRCRECERIRDRKRKRKVLVEQ